MLNKYTPTSALIVYNGRDEDDNNDYYLESREIQYVKGNYSLLSGKPVSKKLLSDLLELVNAEKIANNSITVNGLIPDNVLHYSNDFNERKIIWICKSNYQKLYFKNGLGIEDDECIINVPALIFKLVNDSLYVYAVKNNKVNERTILYRAPFHNIYIDGNVCMGNTIIEQSNDLVEITKNYEKGFFNSKFTHLQSSGTPIKGNLITLFKKLNKDGSKFPKDVLKKAENKRLKDII